ncbi:hypothetical protein HPP92_023567 [Vanilla planifolia]|uniref:BHLH domain-containing protein n=1 Tax=Vanilla planifolia TaxID=51239 RepID=A0A835PM06_VANPL|nr:hypothetical protein HPP92_023832 [Vanilla planifolia]KAG0455779.1 hypothetical protein HPP92_023567 [Vanilla planifolia]
MDPVSMDVWCFDEDNNHSSSSSGSLPRMPYWSSFSSIDESYHAGIPLEEVADRVELGDSEFLASSPLQLDEINMLMESMDSTCQVTEDLQWTQTGNFLQHNTYHHQAFLQSPYQQSLLPGHPSCSTDCSTSSHMLPESKTDRSCNGRFPSAAMEEMEIRKAILSVISSASSSSASSPANCYQSISAFKPYGSCVPLEIHRKVPSQNMIKKSHTMLRRVNMQKSLEEAQTSNYQMQHMVSERRRRERLNASFHSLWQLLPPGSKKDKTSVLCTTISYVRTLRTEINTFEEKNRVLEQQVLSSQEAREQNVSPDERVQVQISRSPDTGSETMQIDLMIMVRVQCDLVRVVLRVLECIKEMRVFNLLSLDATPNSHQTSLLATLKLAIKGSTWDERTFKEAVAYAAHMAL